MSQLLEKVQVMLLKIIFFISNVVLNKIKLTFMFSDVGIDSRDQFFSTQIQWQNLFASFWN